VTVFDLRQETHIFVNGLPVSWYASRDWANVGRSQPEIKAGEAVRLQSLKPESEITVYPGEAIKKSDVGSATPEHVTVNWALAERDDAQLLPSTAPIRPNCRESPVRKRC